MSAPANPINVARAKELLEYDIEEGRLFWRPHADTPPAKWGESAEALRVSDGYMRVRFDGQEFAAHRLAWAIHHGEQPPALIDHRNKIKTDNRPSNLRKATAETNSWNRPTNRHGHVRKRKNGQYEAVVVVRNRQKYVGMFKTAHEAGTANFATLLVTHGMAYLDAVMREQ